MSRAVSGRGPGLPVPIGRDRVEELYERALELNPEARAAFLAEACRGDPQLEVDLASLVAHAEAAEAFFAGLAETVVSPTQGHPVGHYRLIGALGSGGMGTVYRAYDTRLDREVALKFLPPHLSAQLEARERLLVEARAAAALEHPNICSIHEIGETSAGRPFIAMACYEGETLKERLARGSVPPAEAVAIAVQVARGLRAAHAHGIVHRDVKPANVILGTDGMVRLLDFGLAKIADVTLTGPGATPGTVAYMSPEQARGDAVDHRTDLWSLGVVLYEMLTGERPFGGGNDRAVIQAILHEEPEPISKRRSDTPAPLARIAERLLQKSPAGRYGSADALLADLVSAPPAEAITPVRRWIPAFRPVAIGGTGVLAAVALLYLVRTVDDPERLTPPANATALAPAIAVLPFTVRGQGLEVWREGMVDLLSMGLDGAGGLRAIDSRTLLARWQEAVGDKTVADLALALGVASRTQARYALVGSAVAAGPRIRFAADVYDLESGRSVGPGPGGRAARQCPLPRRPPGDAGAEGDCREGSWRSPLDRSGQRHHLVSARAEGIPQRRGSLPTIGLRGCDRAVGARGPRRLVVRIGILQSRGSLWLGRRQGRCEGAGDARSGSRSGQSAPAARSDNRTGQVGYPARDARWNRSCRGVPAQKSRRRPGVVRAGRSVLPFARNDARTRRGRTCLPACGRAPSGVGPLPRASPRPGVYVAAR